MKLKRILALLLFGAIIVGIIYALRFDDREQQKSKKEKQSIEQAITKIINDDQKTDYSFNIKEIKSDSGIRIWHKQVKDSPVVSISFFFKDSGKITIDPDKLGTEKIASSIVMRGLPGKSFEQIVDELDKKNISIGFGAGADYFTGSATFLLEDKDTASAYINDFLTKATMPDNEIEILKKSLKLAIEQRDKSAIFPPNKKMYEILFANNDLYGKRFNKATIQTIDNIQKNDLIKYINSLDKSMLHVSIVSSMDEKEAKQFIDQCFKDLKATKEKQENNEPKFKTIPVATTQVLEHKVPVKANNNQSNLLFFISSIDEKDTRNLIKLSILSKILDKKLYDNVRAKEGLTYHISTSSKKYEYSNTFLTGSTSVEVGNVKKAMQEIRKTLSEIAENGVDEMTFKKNRNSFINHIYGTLTSNPSIASLMSYIASIDESHDYLDKREEIALSIDLDEFNDFIKKLIRPEAVFFVYSVPEK